RQNPAHHVNFPDVDVAGDEQSDTELANTVRRRLLTLWNSYSFFITYAEVDAWRPRERPVDADALGELDRWILSRLQGLVAAAHRAFQELAPYRLVLSFEQFTDDLSNWYIRRSRRRFWKAGSDRDKEGAFQTLRAVLETLIRVMAPILPFLTEEMYQNLVRSVDPEAPESIHLTDYPEVDEALVDKELERKIECVIQTRNLGLGLRSRSGIKVRQPLARLVVRASDAAARAALSEEHFARQLREECNVKALELIDDEGTVVNTRVKANRRSLGRRYGKLLPEIEARLLGLDGAALRDSLDREEKLSLEVNGTAVVVTAEDVELVDEAPEHLVTMSAPGFFAALDVTITEELEAEGIARDLNRHAQDQRRRVGLEIADRITVAYVASDRIATAVADHQDYLKTELLAERIDRVRSVDLGRVVKVGGEEVELAVCRV
ncbi:MAG: class I tRNA ligase family protein, partial [bacterium]|nr:class I tRNA ligase family protein [bacterium]